MGVFGSGGPQAYAASETSGIGKEPCKPDYERMIADYTKRRTAAQNLYNALTEYADLLGGEYNDGYKMLIGSLVIELREYDKSIMQLITLQESATK
jgi:hypothetical protein